MELFVEGKAADGVGFGFEGRVQGNDFDLEGAGGAMGHGGFLLGGAESENRDWKKEEQRGAGFDVHVVLG